MGFYSNNTVCFLTKYWGKTINVQHVLMIYLYTTPLVLTKMLYSTLVYIYYAFHLVHQLVDSFPDDNVKKTTYNIMSNRSVLNDVVEQLS